MYADYEFYTSEYLLGKAPTVPEESFPYWEREARMQIDSYTFGRIGSLPESPEEVKLCTCAVAEGLYQADKAKAEQQESGLAGPLSSWSNDGQSGTVDLSNSTLTETGKMKEVRRLIAQYLCNTGLMYRGLK